MATKSLLHELFDRPYEFEFFQAVYLLERGAPNPTSVGADKPPAEETVRFCSWASLNFPASAIYTLTEVRPPSSSARSSPPVMTVTFDGLFGPNGALPVHYTESILHKLDRGRGEEQTALRDWLDLFNHRLISLFYRAWEKYRPAMPLARYLRAKGFADRVLSTGANTFAKTAQREARRAEPDPFTNVLLNVVGLGARPLHRRIRVSVQEARLPGIEDDEGIDRPALVAIDDLAVLYYAGLFSQRPRNAASLAAVVGDFFGLSVTVRQFTGQWLAIPLEQQSNMTEGGRRELGLNVVAGERVWDVVSSFRLRIGPLRLAQYKDLLPDKSTAIGELTDRRKTFFLLCQLVRLYVGPEYDFEVQLVLAGRDVPECGLVESGREVLGARLGWNTWLKVGPMGDADDAVFAGDETSLLRP